MAAESEEFGEYEEWNAATEDFTLSEALSHFAAPGRLENLMTSTDREYIGRVTAIFDGLLKQLLVTHFRHVSKLDDNRLTDLLNGPLRAFGARHELCGALNLIGPETCKSLSVIRELRNRDSHEEHVPPLSADDVNALRSVGPTFAKKAKKKNASIAEIVENIPGLNLSKKRIEYMDIVQQIHALLVGTLTHLKLGDEHLSI